MVSLLVYSFAFSFKAFFILTLLVIYVILKAVMHFQSRIETVFNCVVCSSRHIFCNKAPFFAVLQEEVHELFVFIESPFLLGDIWVQMIVPSLSALFADPSWQNRCNEIPASGSMFDDHFPEKFIFILGPGAFISSLDLILLL